MWERKRMLQRSSLAERGDPQAREGMSWGKIREQKRKQLKGAPIKAGPELRAQGRSPRKQYFLQGSGCVGHMQRLDLRGEGGSPLPQLCGMEAQEPAPLKGSHRLVLGCLRRLSGWTDDISGTLSSLFLAHRTIFHHCSCTLYILDLNICLHSFISFFNQFMILSEFCRFLLSFSQCKIKCLQFSLLSS